MIKNQSHRVALLCLIPVLWAKPSTQAITRTNVVRDIYGNLLSNNDVKFPASACCVVPTCNSPTECYETLSCGYMCSSGKYAPAEFSNTPGYRLKKSYSRYSCRFGDCKYYDFSCYHCQDPSDADFSIYQVRDDCKECYYRG